MQKIGITSHGKTHIEVVWNTSPLSRQIWGFYIQSFNLVLSSYVTQERQTTRHGWENKGFYQRIRFNGNGANLTADEVEVPQDIEQAAFRFVADSLKIVK